MQDKAAMRADIHHDTRRSAGVFAALFGLALLGFARNALADVSLPSVFSPNMVLQRDKPAPVWGKAAPGERVTVSFAGQTKETTAGADGRWSLRLDPLATSAEPRALIVAGKNRIEIANVLVGEVWVGSGQSNMQWSVRGSNNAEAEAKAADYPRIRLFQIPLVHSTEPRDDVKAEWRACAPDKIQDFSAVLYFFGREIHREIDVPIGLIQSAWGGTRIEPWTPLAGFAKVPALADIHAAAADRAPGGARYKKDAAAYVDAMAQWVPAAREALLSGRGLPAAPQAPNWLPDGHQTPIAIYNAMIHPIVPFAIRGAIWYQGESNNGEGMAYFEKMKALIGGWREVWQEGDFPFYFVQIAPFDYGADRKFQLAELWEAQAAALSIPNTGMAVITDATDLKDIHPRDKQTVGKRLALLALAKNYGRDVVFSGPSYRDHSAEDGRIRVRFHHADGGLASRDGKPLTWFEVAGSDGDYAPAEAAIDDESVVVSSPAVHRPARVRFAWSQLAEPNLVNKAGLPAAAFRTHRPQ